MSIKIELYQLLSTKLKSLEMIEGVKLFNYVGHYNGQELENPNNFSYKTPAAFIAFNQIGWDVTKHKTTDSNLNREQNGQIEFSIHFFFHNLQNDSDSFLDHLEIIDFVYYQVLGLRSDETINGKISTIKRIREFDDTNNNNLRHWQTVFSTMLQETANQAGQTQSDPISILINPVQTVLIYQVSTGANVLGYNSVNGKMTTNG